VTCICFPQKNVTCICLVYMFGAYTYMCMCIWSPERIWLCWTWGMQGARDGLLVSMLGTVWVAVDVGSGAKSGSAQRGPSGDKKGNE
jgi:hypothetical protein